MYREHLLSIEHVQKLLYHQVATDGDNGRRALRAPAFFMSQADRGFKGEFFPPGSEAERRISFFASNPTLPPPDDPPVEPEPAPKPPPPKPPQPQGESPEIYVQRLLEAVSKAEVANVLASRCVQSLLRTPLSRASRLYIMSFSRLPSSC